MVIGGGAGSAAAVAELRKQGYDGSLTLVSAENTVPYERPPLSKGFLLGTSGQVPVKDAAWYEQASVELILGSRATRLDLAARTVTLSGGAALGYDQLLLATGVRPRVLSGLDGDGVCYLRTSEDAAALRDIAAKKRGTAAAKQKPEAGKHARVVAEQTVRFSVDIAVNVGNKKHVALLEDELLLSLRGRAKRTARMAAHERNLLARTTFSYGRDLTTITRTFLHEFQETRGRTRQSRVLARHNLHRADWTEDHLQQLGSRHPVSMVRARRRQICRPQADIERGGEGNRAVPQGC